MSEGKKVTAQRRKPKKEGISEKGGFVHRMKCRLKDGKAHAFKKKKKKNKVPTG